jgi:hypothetical protein
MSKDMSTIEEMPRALRVRRVQILCCAVVRNVAYYRCGWVEKEGKQRPLFESNIERTINANFFDTAVLEWCKLFGEPRHEPQHWERVLSDREQKRAFKLGLLNAIDGQRKDWNAIRGKCIEYRNDFLAHLGSEPEMQLPFLTHVERSAAFFYSFLQDSEPEHLERTEPLDIDAFYEDCAVAGRAYYKREGL